MSRVIFSSKKSCIFYIDDYEIGSTGYLIDYTKGDSSKWISFQCKIKVIDYMIFGTNKNAKKYIINSTKEHPGSMYKRFIIRYSDHMVLVCVKIISDWELDLLTHEEIQNIILFEKKGF